MAANLSSLGSYQGFSQPLAIAVDVTQIGFEEHSIYDFQDIS